MFVFNIYYSYRKFCDVKICLVNFCLFVNMNGIRKNMETCNSWLCSYYINYYTYRKLSDVHILVLAMYPIIMYFKLSMFENILIKNKIINMLLTLKGPSIFTVFHVGVNLKLQIGM